MMDETLICVEHGDGHVSVSVHRQINAETVPPPSRRVTNGRRCAKNSGPGSEFGKQDLKIRSCNGNVVYVLPGDIIL